jgi:hypothetical protein
MVDAATNLSLFLRVGLVLFDETHTRVFAVRGTVIEDAREFTVDLGAPQLPRGRLRAPRPYLAAEQAHERAAQTARLVTDLNSNRPFDCLLVGGPPWARTLVWEHLPAPLRVRLAGSVKLAVGAGESAILGMTLPAVDAVVQRSSRLAHLPPGGTSVPHKMHPGYSLGFEALPVGEAVLALTSC